MNAIIRPNSWVIQSHGISFRFSANNQDNAVGRDCVGVDRDNNKQMSETKSPAIYIFNASNEIA